MAPIPLTNLQQTITSAQTTVRIANRRFRRAHSRVRRFQTLTNLQQTVATAKSSARRANRKLQHAHGRVLRVQTVAARDQKRFVLSVLLPPLGVYLQLGFGPELVLSLLLTVMGFLPGVLHVLYILTSN